MPEKLSNNQRKRLARLETKRLLGTPAELFARASNCGVRSSSTIIPVCKAAATDPLEGEVKINGQRYLYTLTPIWEF